MKQLARLIFLLAIPALLLACAGTTRAQEGAQPKTPPTPSQAVLENWNDVGNRLVTMAQDWPEDKYTYKLNPAVRTFQEVLLHIAGSNYDLINHLAGTKVGEAQNDPPVSQYKTKARNDSVSEKIRGRRCRAYPERRRRRSDQAPFGVDWLYRAHGRALWFARGVLPRQRRDSPGIASQEVAAAGEIPFDGGRSWSGIRPLDGDAGPRSSFRVSRRGC